MASITKRGKVWQARVPYYMPDGTRRFRAKSFPTKREADYWANKTEVTKVEDGTLFESPEPLPDYFVRWATTFKKPNVAEATWKWYEATARALRLYFDGIPISKITREDYQKFLNHVAESHVRSTVSKFNTHVRASIQNALDERLIRRDFTLRAQVSGTKDSKPQDLKFLNADEADALIAVASNHATIKSVSKYMIVTALFTGARLAEIAGLTWDDVNWKFSTIHISKTYDYLHPGNFKPTKNSQSRRVIKVNEGLLVVLKQLKEQQSHYFPTHGIGNPNNLIFINDRGITPGSAGCNKTLRSLLKKIQIRSEVSNLNFHSLRHTHASYLLYKGVSIYYISKRLGHESIATTLSVYSHILNELEKAEAEKTVTALSEMDNRISLAHSLRTVGFKTGKTQEK